MEPEDRAELRRQYWREADDEAQKMLRRHHSDDEIDIFLEGVGIAVTRAMFSKLSKKDYMNRPGYSGDSFV